jgi:hypothetical protein
VLDFYLDGDEPACRYAYLTYNIKNIGEEVLYNGLDV